MLFSFFSFIIYININIYVFSTFASSNFLHDCQNIYNQIYQTTTTNEALFAARFSRMENNNNNNNNIDKSSSSSEK